jgi:hypothetical protein
VLGSLLVGAGVGASLASRVPESRRRLALLIVTFGAGVIVAALIAVARATITQPFSVRAGMSVVALVSAGLLLGLPFPLGMSCFDDGDRSWYWAVNGATSVLASVLAIVVALVAGFSTVLGAALVCYLLAALTLPPVPASAGLQI